MAATSAGDALRPGEFAIEYWREAGLLHLSFAKHAVAPAATNLVRIQFGLLREPDLSKLNTALKIGFEL